MSAHGTHCYDGATLICGWPEFHAVARETVPMREAARRSIVHSTPLRDRLVASSEGLNVSLLSRGPLCALCGRSLYAGRCVSCEYGAVTVQASHGLGGVRLA